MCPQCEQVSHETGCWLFLTAQHANSTSSFIHYTSPRLRRESRPEVTDLVSQFGKLFGSLLAARRQDAKELHSKLVESQNKEAAVTQELSDVRDHQEALQTEADNARQDLLRVQTENAELLLTLRSRLGMTLS
jgi:hypothetical protein